MALEQVRCPSCNTILAARVAHLYVIKHRGREFVCENVLSIQCESCNAVWKPQATAQPAAEQPAQVAA